MLSELESNLLSLSVPNALNQPSDIVKSACAAKIDSLGSDYAKSIFKISLIGGSHKIGTVLPPPSLELLSLGISLLHAFVQVNFTGPNLEFNILESFKEVEVTELELNEIAIELLTYCGEPIYHLTKSATYLLLALQIFGLLPSPFTPEQSQSPIEGPFGMDWPESLESIKIWRLRAALVWIKVLDEPVPLPTYITTDAKALRNSLPSHSPDLPHLSLSLSILASTLSKSSSNSSAQKEATLLAKAAATETGLEYELTGRLGKRTKYQIDQKTQLVILAKDQSSSTTTSIPTTVPQVFDLNDDTLLERTAFTPTTTLSEIDPNDQPHISPFSQAILLALSLSTLTQATSLINLSSDVLSTSQVSAFVSRVLIDPQNWSVHSMALLLRCRAEAGRSRTVERGVLQMQALVDQLKDGSPTEISAISSAVKPEDMAEARERLSQFHALNLPAAWELERELATRYLSLGISKSALEIFTRLEMWEEVARCWVSLERPDRGVEVIRALLEGTKAESELVMDNLKGGNKFRGGAKREAKLWCTLGELEVNSDHYQKAWEVSLKTSSRAQRSLGATYWAAGNYEEARKSLRLALAINPLFPRTWFVLGCCEMRIEDWAGAQEAFGRCVALEDDDAESWSNLASCHLRRGESEGDTKKLEEEAEDEIDSTGVVGSAVIENDEDAVIKLPFSRKRAAFHCLKQAIKHSYESWRIWVNYMVVAVDVGEMSEACRALGRIVEMKAEKDGEGAIDLEVLERLVEAVTRNLGEDEDGVGSHVNPNEGKGLAPRVEKLIVNDILPRISNSPRVFLAHARLLIYSNDFAGALDTHLKAYRAGIATDSTVEHDKKKFLDACIRVEEVVGMLENLGPKNDKDGNVIAKDWKFQARSLVRTFLGRTKDAFEDEPEYERLKELVAELR